MHDCPPGNGQQQELGAWLITFKGPPPPSHQSSLTSSRIHSPTNSATSLEITTQIRSLWGTVDIQTPTQGLDLSLIRQNLLHLFPHQPQENESHKKLFPELVVSVRSEGALNQSAITRLASQRLACLAQPSLPQSLFHSSNQEAA